ncbi:Sec translocon accessory complex subunit YajC [Fusobacterium sp. DD29]|uniref:preprotein translocase subunit YajC n=1 Tax=unclassified Fusobacterium TaxID=2648384 RepID=UPI001B8B3B78|nr:MULTISPECIES: preprotein translocase subunit YajC [unclassified Fusobacterium]MBR8700581.1 Sec translocon accessory complex subunit YajC [Fusobacterium sp. DD45]MBR8710117.1 Sec translocon accessory complex subunit YajC [Fusobacterium sp. DD28]MBR8750330.1 Sec translocon accessory complex subunit YajC [Fusobacterium sp. DD29]MBR8750890.1 Sec translocon accessory complex subunit YajC [Fusobacterium sp. DD26]MBR8762571.1 Sec translocon accessory complex subunit YajC [Fusobacterium sp. DD25]
MEQLLGKYGGAALTFIIWIAVFYFLLILPNKKKQKKQKQMLDSIKEGVEVLTVGGIKGTVASVNEEYIELRVDKGVKITLRKSAISAVLEK